MKKYLFFLLAVLSLSACTEQKVELKAKQDSFKKSSARKSSSKKIDVCHNGKIINVSINALQAHVGHGDAIDSDGDGYFNVENECNMPVDCDDENADLTDNCAISCVEGELEVQVDPDGISENGDEYTLYVYPVDNHPSIIWADIRRTTGANDLWNGKANTDAIVSDQGAGTTYAAGLCASLKEDGCDWYLPAKNELDAMYQQLGPNGGSGQITIGGYWSSTEADETISLNAWRLDFGTGIGSNITKFAGTHCRCVRK